MSLKDIKAKAADFKNKAQDFSLPHLDRAKTAAQPHIDKAMANPHVEKLRDNLENASGKRLEEKLGEYTEVYGEVLLGLHRRAEADRLLQNERQRQMESEIMSLRAAVQELRDEFAHVKKTR